MNAAVAFLAMAPAGLPGIVLAQEAPPVEAYRESLAADGRGVYPVSVAADSAGNAYIASDLEHVACLKTDVRKLSPSGALLWRQEFAGSFHDCLSPVAIALDDAGNMYVGVAADLSDDGVNFSKHGLILKYSPEGVLLSTRTTPLSGSDLILGLSGLAVHAAGQRLYAAQTILSASDENQVLLMEYDLALSLLNTRTLASAPGIEGESCGVAVDAAGNVYASGAHLDSDANEEGTFVTRLSPRLESVIYERTDLPPIMTPVSPGCQGGMAAGAGANAFVAGQTHDENFNDLGALIKLGPDGSTVFISTFRASSDVFFTEFNGVAVDGEGGAYVSAGDQDSAGHQGSHVIKYDSNGERRWALVPYSESASVRGLAVDLERNIYLTAVIWPDGAPASISSVASKFVQAASSGPLALEALSPLDRDATVTRVLSAPLKVRVMEDGRPREGVTVRWEFVSLPAAATGHALLEAPGFPGVASTGLDVPTDQNGESAVQVKLGDMSGEYSIAAGVAGAAPGSIVFAARGRLFLDVRLSTASIKPVPFSRVVTGENRLTATVHAFGVGGSTDAVADYPVVLFSAPYSGGHDHELNRPDGGFSGGGLTVFTSSATGRTNAEGDLFAVFTSTFFAGVEVFFASSTIDPGIASPSTSVVVKAGDFALLDDATYYIKDGGTCLHHGPAGSAGCSTPDRNHYGTGLTTSSIAAVAAEWLAYAGAARMLEINDMSLPLGGGFDVGGGWTSDIVDRFLYDRSRCNMVGHCEHRDGQSVDIQVYPNTSPNTLPPSMLATLKDILRGHSARWHIEGSHWHIRF